MYLFVMMFVLAADSSGLEEASFRGGIIYDMDVTDPYYLPAETCPTPASRPHLDLEAACPNEQLEELRRIEIESSWRGKPEQLRT